MTTSDADIRFVLTHPRFRGVENHPERGEWTIRIADDGHELVIKGTFDDVYRRAADTLRRLP
jgi:hypothetical protein